MGEAQRRYYARNIEAIRARDRERYWLNRDARLARAAELRAARPRRRTPVDVLKDSAHGLIERLVKQGRLIRRSCEICGFFPTQAHHPFGYEGPMALAVWWLCVTHHRGIHAATEVAP